jgi:hypothetical protein
MMGAYLEYGAVGCIIILFATQLIWMQKKLGKRLDESIEIVVRLIDRHNKTDEKMDNRFERLRDSAERRHEILIKEFDDLSDTTRSDISFIKGRINGKSK